MRDDLAREAALHWPVEPACCVGLPRSGPGGEAHVDGDALGRADVARVHPVPDRRYGKGGGEGEVNRAPVAGLGHEGPCVRDVDGKRLLAEDCPARSQRSAGMREMRGGRRGDVDAVAGRDQPGRIAHLPHLRKVLLHALQNGRRRVPETAGVHPCRILLQDRVEHPLAHDAGTDDADRHTACRHSRPVFARSEH